MKASYHEIKSENLRVVTSDLGAHLVSVFVKEEDGTEKDYVLGYGSMEDSLEDSACIGSVIGRVVNRIRNGEFKLDGKTYQLSKNQGIHHIHGGFAGFKVKTFDVVSEQDDAITYRYVSPDMEEGYPGTLTLDVTYKVEKSDLTISFVASTDKDTIVNPTCHVYFNLADQDELITDHELKIDADQVICVDKDGIPTGKFKDVEGSVFDFRNGMRIGEHLFDQVPELTERKGYDHAFILNEGEGPQIVLCEPKSGRKVSITTVLPSAQVYTGNYLGGAKGKNGVIYKDFGGVAIETQFMTDSIHIEEEPKVILRAGDECRAWTKFTFGR